MEDLIILYLVGVLVAITSQFVYLTRKCDIITIGNVTAILIISVFSWCALITVALIAIFDLFDKYQNYTVWKKKSS